MAKKLSTIARTGNRLDTLRALRKTLAKAIETSTSSRDIASLVRQMTDVMEKIAELENNNHEEEVAVIDVIIKKGSAGNAKPGQKSRPGK